MTLVTLMTLEYSLFLQGIPSSIRLAPAPYTSCGTELVAGDEPSLVAKIEEMSSAAKRTESGE